MSAPIDPWGSPAPSTARPTYASKARVVKDSWDDSSASDEDDTQPPPPAPPPPKPDSNQEIWENANKHDRMPEIVSSSSVPPVAALSGPMRILKRPTPAAAPATPPPESKDAARKRLDARAAEYQAARERIFGKDSPNSSASSTPKRSGAQSPAPPTATTTTVSRQPRGPDAAVGFTKPRTKQSPRKANPPANTASQTQGESPVAQ
ncbi:hypothetical protein AURDEDRAFT_158865 [Auricularia subglabra TFB-10046 SS5]|nr:hypothetical protein AURDEDRAFT_158865 [Auricularia subglabra TFB-10046 SS5]